VVFLVGPVLRVCGGGSSLSWLYVCMSVWVLLAHGGRTLIERLLWVVTVDVSARIYRHT